MTGQFVTHSHTVSEFAVRAYGPALWPSRVSAPPGHAASHRYAPRVEIWNNPACSKCAAARATLDDAGQPYAVRDYLQQPPTAEELTDVLRRLGQEPWDITRLREPVAAELGLATAPRDDRNWWIATLVAHPALIQRPIVLLDDGHALVARDAPTLASIRDALRTPAP